MTEIAIHLLKGLGGLKFGETKKRAVDIFGEADETEELFDELLNEKSTVCHYWDQGFSLFFKDNADRTFTCAEVDYKEATLFGKKLFKLSEKQIIDLFKENGFSLSETEQHAWGERRVSFDDAFADLYFENGKLASINFCMPEGPTVNLSLN
jgi:hypothetical protein